MFRHVHAALRRIQAKVAQFSIPRRSSLCVKRCVIAFAGAVPGSCYHDSPVPHPDPQRKLRNRPA